MDVFNAVMVGIGISLERSTIVFIIHVFSAIWRFLQAPGRREPQWGGEDVSSNGVS